MVATDQEEKDTEKIYLGTTGPGSGPQETNSTVFSPPAALPHSPSFTSRPQFSDWGELAQRELSLRLGNGAQSAERLPGMHETWSSISSTK